MRPIYALVALILLVAPASAQGEVRRYFKDWLAACRTDGYCSATAYQNPNPGGGMVADYILRVGRHAEQSYWELSFTTVATMADDWSDFIVDVDGTPQTFAARGEVGPYGSVNEFYFLDEAAQVLMDRLVPGKAISISFNDTSATAQQAKFSLSGLSAALIWIDEQQKRLGSERVAGAPPYGLTPTGSEQQSTPQVPVALLDRLRADPECTPMEDLPNGRDIVVDQLSEETTLYILPCWGAAYNFGSKVFTGAFDEFSQLYFADYSEAFGWSGTPFVVNFSYDPGTKTLMSLNKGRGIGDCGSAGEWAWSDYGFKLVRFRSKDACDATGEEDEMPEFPVIYEAPPAAGPEAPAGQ